MENETKKSKLTAKDILAKTGPGIIMAAAAVGTGTVTTSAILGARYEYGMIWMVILALFMRGIYMRSAYTAQVVLGMPILDCINKFYGKALCASLTIPSKCNALMNKQLFPTESIDSFIDDLQRIYAERVCVGNLTICREIPSYPAYQLSPEQSDVQRLTSLLRKQFGHAPELRINQSVSDGNILYNELRIPTVLFGPHGVAFHTECEYVKISSLSQYMDELYAFIKQEYTR